MDFEVIKKQSQEAFSELEPLRFFYINSPESVYWKLPETYTNEEGKKLNAFKLQTKALIYVAEVTPVMKMFEKLLLQEEPFEETEDVESNVTEI